MKLFFGFHYYLYLFISLLMHLYLYFNEKNLKPCKVICKFFFYDFIIIYIYSNLYLCIYTPSYPHFKAFPVSKFNSKKSFLYQQNSFFFFHFFLNFYFIYLFMYFFVYTPSNQHFKAFLVSLEIQFRDQFSLSTFQGEFKFYSYRAM